MREETNSGEFHCLTCTEQRRTPDRGVQTNGRRMAKSQCPSCGTNLNRILGKA
jgi:transcription initiation factor IIE alpha subunit